MAADDFLRRVSFTRSDGSKTENGAAYAVKSSTSDYYVTISTFSVEQRTTATPTDFIQQPSPVRPYLHVGVVREYSHNCGYTHFR